MTHNYPQHACTPADARRLHAHKHAPHELTVRLARDQRAVRVCSGCRASARVRASGRSAAGAPGEGRRALQARGRARREGRGAARAARLPEPEGGREERRLVRDGRLHISESLGGPAGRRVDSSWPCSCFRAPAREECNEGEHTRADMLGCHGVAARVRRSALRWEVRAAQAAHLRRAPARRMGDRGYGRKGPDDGGEPEGRHLARVDVALRERVRVDRDVQRDLRTRVAGSMGSKGIAGVR